MNTQLTRIRIEGVAETEVELRDYLLSCVEDQCNLYGRVWEQTDELQVVPTNTGYWGRVTIQRMGLTRESIRRLF